MYHAMSCLVSADIKVTSSAWLAEHWLRGLQTSSAGVMLVWRCYCIYVFYCKQGQGQAAVVQQKCILTPFSQTDHGHKQGEP